MRQLRCLLLTASLLLVVSACGNEDKSVGDRAAPTSTPIVAATSTDFVEPTAPNESIHFVQVVPPEGPLGRMAALLIGPLEVTNRCLTINGNVIVWPHDAELDTSQDPPVVRDTEGRIVAEVGEEVSLGGGEVGSYRSVLDGELTEPLPPECTGAFWIVGDFVYPATPTPPGSSSSEIDFPIHRGTGASGTPTEMMAGLLNVADGCLVFTPSDSDKALTVIWPPESRLDTSAMPVSVQHGDQTRAISVEQPGVLTGYTLSDLSGLDVDPPPICQDPYLVATEISTDDALAYDAAWYAVDYGVSLALAIERFHGSAELGSIPNDVEVNETDTFAGFFLQHEPEYRYVFLFTEHGEETLAPYIEGNPFADKVEVRHVRYTLEDLKAAQQALNAIMQQADIRASHGISVQTNAVEVYISDRASFDAKLAAAGLTLPEPVKVIAIQATDEED